MGSEVKVRHVYKYVYFLDAVERMPEFFSVQMVYEYLPSRYFSRGEVPSYLKKVSMDGVVERVGDGVDGGALWRRRGKVNASPVGRVLRLRQRSKNF